MKILFTQKYESGQDVFPGVLYQLDKTAMVVEGVAEFYSFGRVMVDDVELPIGVHRLECPERITLTGGPKSGVLFKTNAVEAVYEPAAVLPDQVPIEDSERARFKAWAIELGLIQPGARFQDEVEDDDDHGEDDDDSEFDLDWPLDLDGSEETPMEAEVEEIQA